MEVFWIVQVFDVGEQFLLVELCCGLQVGIITKRINVVVINGLLMMGLNRILLCIIMVLGV